jgi:hypothetical protein
MLLLSGIAMGATTVYPEADAVTYNTQVTNTVTTTGFGMSTINGVASAGDTTVVAVAGGTTVKVFRYDFKPEGDLTGMVNLQAGVANIYAIKNALEDNVYGKNLIPNYNEGADGADLVINSSGSVRYNIDYKVE